MTNPSPSSSTLTPPSPGSTKAASPNAPPYDLLVIGGGINGVGVAMTAAGSGLQVLLCDQGDLASGTSSASSKLIHGGLRYLQHGHFRLVREALLEREVLLRMAPHIIWPLRFRLPLMPGGRPAWQLRIGLWLYDHLSRRNQLQKSMRCHFDSDELKPSFRDGFEYADAWVDDSRLVILCARQAHLFGARIRNYCRFDSASVENGMWRVQLRSTGPLSGNPVEPLIAARMIVNAGGPWADAIAEKLTGQPPSRPLQKVKGSHIVVPRIGPSPHAYLLQHSDGRVVFVLPFEDGYSLIGTTEQHFDDDPAKVMISDDEERYLLDVVNQYLQHPLTTNHVVHRFAGVRPLTSVGGASLSAASRDYELDQSHHQGAPLLTIRGGKITSFRQLADKAVKKISTHFPSMQPANTESWVLPGGDFTRVGELRSTLAAQYPWLEHWQLNVWIRRYGNEVRSILGDAKDIDTLGEHFGGGLYQREVNYLCQQEWAVTADDILWRRTKYGLIIDNAQHQRLQNYLNQLQ